MIEVETLIAWILEHRGEKVFRGWTPDQIRGHIAECIMCSSLIYVAKPSGEIVGLATGVKYASKVMYVSEVLCTEEGALQKIVAAFAQRFPGWTIKAHRHGKYVTFNTTKLIQKLCQHQIRQVARA